VGVHAPLLPSSYGGAALGCNEIESMNLGIYSQQFAAGKFN